MKQTVNPVQIYYKITIGYTNRLWGCPVILQCIRDKNFDSYPKAMAFTKWTLLPNMINESKGKWQPVSICASARTMYISILTFACAGLPWVPEDIFFLTILMARGEAVSTGATSREPYQIVSTVYFLLGILRTDLWSQGSTDLEPSDKNCHASCRSRTREVTSSLSIRPS